MNIPAVRDGLKTRVETVTAIRAYDTIPDNANPPCAVVSPSDPFIDYHEAMRKGLAAANFDIVLLASRASERSGQDLLDAWLSSGTSETSSLIDAIHAEKTLGGACSDVIVKAATGYGTLAPGGNDTASYLTATLTVTVYCPRS